MSFEPGVTENLFPTQRSFSANFWAVMKGIQERYNSWTENSSCANLLHNYHNNNFHSELLLLKNIAHLFF